MNKTLAFVGLDFNLMKPYVKGTLILFILGLFMGYGMKSTSILSSFFTVILMVVMSYPFAVGDKHGLDILYSTLSLNRKNIVVGRYMFVLILEVICAGMIVFFSWILSIIINMDFIFVNELFTLCLLSGAFSFVVAIQYPIYFKFGYNKAKSIALIPLFAVFLVILQLPALAKLLDWNFSWEALLTNLMINPFIMNVASVALGLILLVLSCLLSCKIYSKRDI